MNCTEFLARFSDYRDGRMESEERARARAHLRECASCSRYRRVVEQGVELLCSREPIPVPDDFRPRLTHRLYHVDDDESLGFDRSSSGTSLAAALGMAVLLTAVAWSPVMRDAEPEVRLPAIVVSQPSRARPTLTVSPATFFGDRALRFRAAESRSPLWSDHGSLLHEYSPLQGRVPVTTTFRAGLD